MIPDSIANYCRNIYESLSTIAAGMWITFKTAFFERKVTLQYPSYDVFAGRPKDAARNADGPADKPFELFLGAAQNYRGPLNARIADRFRGLLGFDEPSIKFNSPAKTMEIGRGNSARRIPFSNISQIAAQPHTTSIAILASLENGEVLRLGSLSGVGTIEQDTIARAASIVQYIEAAIGTDNRQEQLSEKDGQSPDFPKATSVSPIWKQGLKFGVVFGGLLTAVLSYALYQSGAELNLVVLAFSSLLSFALYTAIFSVIGMALIWIWRLALRLARQFRKN